MVHKNVYIFLCGFLLISLLGASQNLVRNGDFTQMRRCDTVMTQFEILFSNWFMAPQKSSNHPGVIHNMHDCQTRGMFSAPPSIAPKYGYVKLDCYFVPKPAAGKGYPVLLAEDDTGTILNGTYNTLIQSELKQKLTAQDTYHLAFTVAAFKLNDDIMRSYGLYLSRDTVKKAHIDSIVPQLSTPEWYNDTLWNRFDTVFVAQGGERFVTVGNFWPCDDAHEKDNPYSPPTSARCVAVSNNMVHIDAVSVYPLSQTRFTIDLPTDTSLCGRDSLLLHPQIRGGIPDDTSTTYLWSTGSTDSTLTVTQPGTYWVRITQNRQFSQSDTIVVTGAPPLPVPALPDTMLCRGDSLWYELPQDSFFVANWQDGFPNARRLLWADSSYAFRLTSFCDTQSFSFNIPSINCDTVPEDSVTNPDDTIELSDYELIIPDAFTPDGDGLNDSWEIPGLPPGSEVIIFNRWGERVFYSPRYQQPWRGRDEQGEKVPGGVYIYRINYPTPGGGNGRANGWVKVLR